jgi:primosomal protein N''
MKNAFLDIDLKKRTAKLLDGGVVKANFSTLDRVGKSLAALLSLPEAELAKHKNDWVYFSSFLVSQADILESALRATGTKREDWAITDGSAKDVRDWAKAEAAKGNHTAAARSLFALMFSDRFGGNYNDKLVDYEKLGLELEENLDEVMKKLVQELDA